jgi:hypothetical protein
MLDGKGRLFGRVNLLDLGIVLLIIGALAFAGYKKWVVNPRIAPVLRTYIVKVLVEDIRQATVKELVPGAVVREVDANAVMGTVIFAAVQPGRKLVETADGRFVLAEMPEKFDVILTIEAQAQVTDWTIRIANTDLRIGTAVKVGSKRFLVKGIIVGLEER